MDVICRNPVIVLPRGHDGKGSHRPPASRPPYSRGGGAYQPHR
jgi:hypothetical protein